MGAQFDGARIPIASLRRVAAGTRLATVEQMSAKGTRRSSALCSMLVVVAITGACGSGSGGSSLEQAENTDSACALVDRLDDAAAPLASIDVSDPDSFRRDLDAAVLDYVNTLDSLAEMLPESLRGDAHTMQEHVQRYEFVEAIAARAPVDDWADRSCSGR
jgi:hypothetical protein